MFEELYELLTDTMEPEEALEWMQKLSNKIDNDPGDVIMEFDDFIKNKAIDHNLCPICFTTLKTKTYKQSSEYGGRPVDEPIYIPTCPSCGFEIE